MGIRSSNTGQRSAHPTIATIAAHLGLSRATVTHVLNGRGTEQRIRKETQQRVMEVARELGYRPNAAARAVRAGRFGSVALIQSQIGEYLPPELLYGLTSSVAAREMRLMLTHVLNVDTSGEDYVAHTMRELSVDGVFVNRHGFAPSPYLDKIHELRIPAVFLNSKQEFDAVSPDDLQGGRLATEYLLGLGHERIAYVETEPRQRPHYSENDRREGFKQAVEVAGRAAQICTLPVHWHAEGDHNADARVGAAMRLMKGADRPTAVVAYELTEAMAVIRAALVLGLRIPEDLSIIQFHHRIDDQCFCPIYTVSNMMHEVGEAAALLLMEKIENPDTPLPSKVVPEILLDGATCAPPSRR